MKYCLVIDGVIHKYNIDKPMVVLGTQEGVYLPLEDNTPSYDSATQRISGISYEVLVDKVVKTYTVIDIPVEELQANLQKELERTIEAHIDSVVKSKGYNNQDSIAKYLVDTNPFYEECKAISVWIGNVWIKAQEIQSEVEAGTRPIPTINEVIAELPVLA